MKFVDVVKAMCTIPCIAMIYEVGREHRDAASDSNVKDPKLKPETKPCKRCKGSGWSYHDEDGADGYSAVKCPKCDGHGEVTRG